MSNEELKKQREDIKKKMEELGFTVANVRTVWSNGVSSRIYVGQDKDASVSNGKRKMISVLIEINDLDE